jgi:L-amino acid N-acyltransferase YncA
MSVLRRAILDDVDGIASVVQDVWEQEILADVCAAQVQDDTCALWVATDAGDVAGFVSAFLTLGHGGVRRWEVDLLAVRRASQGRGLGRTLVRAAYQEGVRHGVAVARAAIRVDNVASQRAFQHAGFATDRRVHELLLWFPRPDDGADDAGHATLVPVDTLTYRGLWIEGLTARGLTPREQRDVVRTARARVAREGRLNAGAVIPVDEEHLLAADLRDQASVHGEYYWFVKEIAQPLSLDCQIQAASARRVAGSDDPAGAVEQFVKEVTGG